MESSSASRQAASTGGDEAELSLGQELQDSAAQAGSRHQV